MKPEVDQRHWRKVTFLTAITSKEMSHNPATVNSRDNKLCFFFFYLGLISVAPCGFEAVQLKPSPDIKVSHNRNCLLEELVLGLSGRNCKRE